MPTEIQCIQRSLDRHMEDLHLLFTNDATSIDVSYYNQVNLALLEAKATIQKVDEVYQEEMAKFAKKHGRSNI